MAIDPAAFSGTAYAQSSDIQSAGARSPARSAVGTKPTDRDPTRKSTERSNATPKLTQIDSDTERRRTFTDRSVAPPEVESSDDSSSDDSSSDDSSSDDSSSDDGEPQFDEDAEMIDDETEPTDTPAERGKIRKTTLDLEVQRNWPQPGTPFSRLNPSSTDADFSPENEPFDPALLSNEDDVSETTGEPAIGGAMVPPKSNRRFLQRISGQASWLPSTGGFGLSEYDLRATFATFPILKNAPPPMITPNFGIDQFDSPPGVEIPHNLYSLGIDFRLMKPINDWLIVDFGGGPSLFSDFNTSDSRRLRFVGRAMVLASISPKLQVGAGVVYTGRQDFPIFPGVGLIISPSEDRRIELIMPRPRFAQRVAVQGDREHWLFAGGEIGGNSWAFDRANGSSDVVTYRDFRLTAGWELRPPADFTGRPGPGLNARLEAGWVFGRYIEYAESNQTYSPNDTWMLRGSISF